VPHPSALSLFIPSLDGLTPEISLRRATRLLNDPRNFQGGSVPNWWIGVGTALGFCRERGFIAGDTDIDIRIGLDYAGNAAARNYAAGLVTLFEREDFVLVREAYFDGLVMQTAFADARNHGVIVDIYYFYTGISEDHYVNLNQQSLRKKPRHFVDNKRPQPWPGHDDIIVNVPYPVEGYNEWRFGPEWRTKKKRSEQTAIDTRCLLPLPVVTTLTYGTFDIFHFGHLRFLQRLRQLGDHMVVGVVSDAVCRIKGKSPWQDERTRVDRIQQLGLADEVFLQRDLDQKERDIQRFGASYLVVGDDWSGHPRFESVRGFRGVEIIYLTRTPIISTTLIKFMRTAVGMSPVPHG
jgi:glycerol-3-phosphate cytidylyltransferase